MQDIIILFLNYAEIHYEIIKESMVSDFLIIYFLEVFFFIKVAWEPFIYCSMCINHMSIHIVAIKNVELCEPYLFLASMVLS